MPVRACMEDCAANSGQFTIAGAAIGVVAPKFTAWHPAF
jgi:hypothetical protein